jgi:excisionase family DNA binding protein
MDEMLTTTEAALELGLRDDTIRKYCQQGKMGKRFGRVWMITRSEIEQFKDARRPPGRPPGGDGPTYAR